MNKREMFLIECMKLIGIPYIWNGKDPMYGLDCSGLLFNLLKILIVSPPLTNAQGYYNCFEGKAVDVLPGGNDLGDIIFYGQENKIHHCAVALNNKLMIEAAHGDPSITNASIAFVKNAKVMVNPITRLPDFYAALRVPGLFS